MEPVPIVDPSDLWFDVDTGVTCTAQEVTGYTFSHWTVDDVSQGAGVNPTTVTIDGPHTVIAHYTLTSDFIVNVEPSSGTVVQGGSTTATVSLTSIGGYSEIVTLTASSQPIGVSMSFDPERGTPTFTSSVIITVAQNIEPRTYTITITGTGADTTVHISTYELTVATLQLPVGGIISPSILELLAPSMGLVGAIGIVFAIMTIAMIRRKY